MLASRLRCHVSSACGAASSSAPAPLEVRPVLRAVTDPAQHHVQRPLVLYADVSHADCQVTEGDRKMLPAANSPDSGRCDTKAFETDQAAAAVLFPGVLCSCHKQLNVQPEQPVDA